jgi:hypothetical protein
MHERNVVMGGAAVAFCALLAAAPAQPPPQAEVGPLPRPKAGPSPGYRNVYRLAGINIGDHLYSTDGNEIRSLTDAGAYRLDGVGFRVRDREYPNSVPLYRFSTPTGRHFLHTDQSAGSAEGATRGGLIGYVDSQPRPGTVPLYAWFNPATGDSFYTTDRTGEQAPQMGMQYRGIVCYVSPA